MNHRPAFHEQAATSAARPGALVDSCSDGVADRSGSGRLLAQIEGSVVRQDLTSLRVPGLGELVDDVDQLVAVVAVATRELQQFRGLDDYRAAVRGAGDLDAVISSMFMQSV